jgi:hypothetical protein
MHTFQKRRFENLTRLIDTINALDPDFREPYLMADALITFQGADTPHDEVVKAREILERGARNRPNDGEMWLVLGEFTAFIAPSYLKDQAEKDEWRRMGAEMLAHAGELSGDDSRIGWQAMSGAGILQRGGQRDAAVRFLQRMMAVTGDDDQALKARIQRQLDKLLGEEKADEYKRRMGEFSALWRADLPFAAKTTILVLGPPPDPAYCAGGEPRDDVRCATSWRAWFERQHDP